MYLIDLELMGCVNGRLYLASDLTLGLCCCIKFEAKLFRSHRFLHLWRFYRSFNS